MRSKRLSRRRKQDDEETHAKLKLCLGSSMSLPDRMVLFWNENADKVFVPYLNKTDMIKLQMSK